jgi:hypothetical protein
MIEPASKKILEQVGILLDDDSNEILVDRDAFLDPVKYESVEKYLAELKKEFSSSFLTSLQNNAPLKQKWLLLNLVRQILRVYHFDMKPIRKADGYTADGKKRFKRYFLICKSKQEQEQ